ncbi:MAG: type II secretion system protein GspG [Planctomycetes bacterium]|nr:type II secretion system protein GspG [Planctomycetota bacterium]
MFVSMIALVTIALSTVAPAEDPARLLPADTIIYFGSSSLKDGQTASRQTAMSRILSEPEMRSFLHEPTRAAEHVLSTLMEQARADMGGEDMPVSLPDEISLDITKTDGELPVGQFFFGLTHVGMPGMPGAPADRPDVGLVIGVELLDPSMIDMVKTLWGAIPWAESKSSHGGVEYLTRTEPMSGAGVSLAVLGKLAVISASETTLNGIIDRSQGAGSPSLADSADYKQLVQAAGGLQAGGSSDFVRVGALAPLGQFALGMALAQDGMEPEMMQKVLSFYDSLGLGAMKYAGGVSYVSADGKIHSTNVMSVDPSSRGLLPRLVTSGKGIDKAQLATLPGDCQSASLAYMSPVLPIIYDFAMDALASFEPEMAEVAKTEIAQVMGESDLRNDVLANLGGPVMSVTLPGAGLMAQPEGIVTVGLKDGSKFAAAVRQLGQSLQAMAGAQAPVRLKESDHEGTPFFEIELAGQLGMMGAMGFQPAFAVEPDRLVYSSSARRLRTTLNGPMDVSKGSLADDERFMGFVNGLAKRGDLQTVTYANTKSSFATGYTMGIGQLQAAAMFLGEMPVDLAKLPASGTIEKYLDASYAGTYSPSAGTFVTTSLSEFQVSDFLPMVAVIGLAVAGQQMGIKAEAVEPEVDPIEVVQRDLRELKASLRVYKIDQNAYPADLSALLQPLQDFPEGAYPHDALPADPWGHGYLYKLVEKRGRETPMLWSVGPNGTDEGGEGDDIVNL